MHRRTRERSAAAGDAGSIDVRRAQSSTFEPALSSARATCPPRAPRSTSSPTRTGRSSGSTWRTSRTPRRPRPSALCTCERERRKRMGDISRQRRRGPTGGVVGGAGRSRARGRRRDVGNADALVELVVASVAVFRLVLLGKAGVERRGLDLPRGGGRRARSERAHPARGSRAHRGATSGRGSRRVADRTRDGDGSHLQISGGRRLLDGGNLGLGNLRARGRRCGGQRGR